jgi:hypothetical protein
VPVIQSDDRLNMRAVNSNLSHCHILFTAACCACKQNDQLRRLSCTAEGVWCVRLCPRSRALDSGPTDETFSTAALQGFWHVTNGIFMYACFTVPTSRSHVHQSALSVGSMLQLSILSWTSSSEGVVPTGGRYGSVPTGAFSRVAISALRFGLTLPAR